MANLSDSIRAKLHSIAKDQKIRLQDLIHQYGAEQFLARLSASDYVDRFIFKGGALLTYLIDTERQTKDLDFSIRQISNQMNDTLSVVKEILSIPVDDGLIWKFPEGEKLNLPTMDYSGLRIKCEFSLGVAKGLLRMDLAIGDVVEARKIYLERIRYNGKSLIGADFDILAYPPETIFAEKLQTAIQRGINNSRMKDYYDLFKLAKLETLDPKCLKKSVETTFGKRDTPLVRKIDFSESVIQQLQSHWTTFVKKMRLGDAPEKISEVIDVVNKKLKQML